MRLGCRKASWSGVQQSVTRVLGYECYPRPRIGPFLSRDRRERSAVRVARKRVYVINEWLKARIEILLDPQPAQHHRAPPDAFALPSFSATLAFTNFLINAAGGALSTGNRIVPFDVS